MMAKPDKQETRVTTRPEYLAVAATGRKWVTPAFILQAKPGSADVSPRTGYTVSKKVGNAVVRNRTRRRLKEAARLVFAVHGQKGWDYVLIGRQGAPDYPFEKLQSDMKWGLAKLAANADLKSQRKNSAKKGASLK